MWVSLFCTFVSCGQSNTKTTWNKTFGERVQNSWANQSLLPSVGSFNRLPLKCKNTKSYFQPTGSEEGIEYGFQKEGGGGGGKSPVFFFLKGGRGVKRQIPSL